MEFQDYIFNIIYIFYLIYIIDIILYVIYSFLKCIYRLQLCLVNTQIVGGGTQGVFFVMVWVWSSFLFKA